MNQNECQFPSLKSIAEGDVKMPIKPIIKRRLRFYVKSHLSPHQVQTLKRYVNDVRTILFSPKSKNSSSAMPITYVPTEPLMAGDLVRVRSLEEIMATLDSSGKTKGCFFMGTMKPYCGSEQRVLKTMERFFDERDMKAKKCKGMVLLEGVMCDGNTFTGRCDRCCFMFWREEWLEKIE